MSNDELVDVALAVVKFHKNLVVRAWKDAGIEYTGCLILKRKILNGSEG